MPSGGETTTSSTTSVMESGSIVRRAISSISSFFPLSTTTTDDPTTAATTTATATATTTATASKPIGITSVRITKRTSSSSYKRTRMMAPEPTNTTLLDTSMEQPQEQPQQQPQQQQDSTKTTTTTTTTTDFTPTRTSEESSSTRKSCYCHHQQDPIIQDPSPKGGLLPLLMSSSSSSSPPSSPTERDHEHVITKQTSGSPGSPTTTGKKGCKRFRLPIPHSNKTTEGTSNLRSRTTTTTTTPFNPNRQQQRSRPEQPKDENDKLPYSKRESSSSSSAVVTTAGTVSINPDVTKQTSGGTGSIPITTVEKKRYKRYRPPTPNDDETTEGTILLSQTTQQQDGGNDQLPATNANTATAPTGTTVSTIDTVADPTKQTSGGSPVVVKKKKRYKRWRPSTPPHEETNEGGIIPTTTTTTTTVIPLEMMTKFATIPNEGTLQHAIYRQQRGTKAGVSFLSSSPATNSTNIPLQEELDVHLVIFYKWIQSRMAMGWVRSCLFQLQESLLKGYSEAVSQYAQARKAPYITHHHEQRVMDDNHDDDQTAATADSTRPVLSLLELRHRLAGLWCIYAHVVLEVGIQAYQEQQRQRDNRTTSTTTAGVTTAELEFQNVLNHAIAILETARMCPLVGNHKHIVLALGRLLVVGSFLEDGGGWSKALTNDLTYRTTMDSKPVIQAVSDAVSACGEAMTSCRGILLPDDKDETVSAQNHCYYDKAEVSIDFLSRYGGVSSSSSTTNGTTTTTISSRARSQQATKATTTPTEPFISATIMGRDMKAVLALPGQWRNQQSRNSTVSPTTPTTMVVCDRNAARALCHEVNRWSRLKEKLEQRLWTVLVHACERTTTSDTSTTSTTSTPTAGTPWLEHLVFYRTMDCSSDVPPPSAKWHDVEHAMVLGDDSREGKIEWKW
jgi:hypothetical protein